MDPMSFPGFGENLPATMMRIGSTGRSIYLICISMVLGFLVCLPLIRVPVTVKGQGYLRPELERAEIVPVMSGIVEAVFVREGQKVSESEPVIRIRQGEANMNSVFEELQETTVYLEDIGRLLQQPMQPPVSNRFIREAEAYSSRLEYLELVHEKAVNECLRYSGLHDEKLISEKQYEDLCFERERTGRDMDRFISESRDIWQETYQETLWKKRELEDRIARWEEQVHLSTVPVPVNGSLVEFQGIYPGTAIRAGESIGVISPDSRLIGEFYLDPANIAFIYPGQEVRLRLQAYPAREWGMPAGRIYEISEDFLLINDQITYRIKCRLEDTCVALKNGRTGQLKKGMTFQAQCMVTKRSLLQLIWDKTDNWLNPLSDAKD